MLSFASVARCITALRLRASSRLAPLCTKNPRAATALVAAPPAAYEPKICVYFARNDPEALPPTVPTALAKLLAESYAKYHVQALSCAFDRAAAREVDGLSHTAKRKLVQAAGGPVASDLGLQAAPAAPTARPKTDFDCTVAHGGQSSTASASSTAGSTAHRRRSRLTTSAPVGVARIPLRVRVRQYQQLLEQERSRHEAVKLVTPVAPPTACQKAAKTASRASAPRIPLRVRVRQYQQQQLELQRLQGQGQPQQSAPALSAPQRSPAALERSCATVAASGLTRAAASTSPTPRLDVGSRYKLYAQTAQYQTKLQHSLDLQRRLSTRREQAADSRAEQAAEATGDGGSSACASALASHLAHRLRACAAIGTGPEPQRDVAARYMNYTQTERYQEKLRRNLEHQPTASKRARKPVLPASTGATKPRAASPRPKAVESRLNAYLTDARWVARRAENSQRAAAIGVVRTTRKVAPPAPRQEPQATCPRVRVPLRLRIALRLALAHELARQVALFVQLQPLVQHAVLLAAASSPN